MRFTKTIASASVAAVMGLGGVSIAGATSGGSSQPPVAQTLAVSPAAAATAAGTPVAAKNALRAIRRPRLRRAAALVARTIGITPADLVSELRAGKTIATIATEHGVRPQAVIDALEAATTAKIEAAKAAGKITARRATRLGNRFERVIPKFVNDWHLHRPTA